LTIFWEEMVELVELVNRSPAPLRAYEFEEWSSDLKGICGNFAPQRYERSDAVFGTVRVEDAAGIGVAQVANNLGAVVRDHQHIRSDYGENLFLLIQLEGFCGIEQRGLQSRLDPGDCVLVDSANPSIFHFNGNFSNHLSVHMPRQLLYAGQPLGIEIARRLGAADPMSAMLRALVAKLLSIGAEDRRAPHLRQLLFDTTRQAFATVDELEMPAPSHSSGARLEIVQILIDRHLTEENLTPRWLAKRLGVSLRTLQDDFSVLGTTATSHIRMQRLNLARDQLRQMRGAEERPNIAEIAYSSGFNDISYFNRCFRQAFDCSPKDVLHADG
jgi:AraC-like DNA-binding protein